MHEHLGILYTVLFDRLSAVYNILLLFVVKRLTIGLNLTSLECTYALRYEQRASSSIVFHDQTPKKRNCNCKYQLQEHQTRGLDGIMWGILIADGFWE